MPDQDATDFVLILEVRNAGDQALIKSLLDAEGIVYFMQGEHVAPYLYNALPMRQTIGAKWKIQSFNGEATR